MIPHAYASKKVDPSQCKVFYSVVQKDTLGNIVQGISRGSEKWIKNDLQKKYPMVCYADPNPSIKLVLFITIEKATYNGTRTVVHNSTTSGTVRDNSGNTGSYSGNSTYSEVVPDNFDYGRYMLTIEDVTDMSNIIVKHRFQQDGIYRTMYGIPLGGRGHHPEKAIIEDAVKWISSGGLTDPLQSSQ